LEKSKQQNNASKKDNLPEEKPNKNEENATPTQPVTTTTPTQKAKEWIADKSGASDINLGHKKIQNQKKINAAKQKIKKAEMIKQNTSDAEMHKQAEQDIADATSSLKEFEKVQKDLEQDGKTAWDNIGDGIQKAGAAITGVGIAASMLGGIFSSLGLEELGEGFAKAGNLITMFGAGISALGSIIPAVASIAEAAGVSVGVAWGWVALVVAGVAILVTTAVLIFKEIEKHNPEKIL
jgi:hypothetical protein